jgi:hypothetical protein
VIAVSSETTSAIIAAIAVLGGVVVGGLVTALTTAYFERRRDSGDIRQARRLVAEELRSIYNHLYLLSSEREYPSNLPESPTFLPTEQWEANRALLARHLDELTWDELSPFMDSIPATRVVLAEEVFAGKVAIPPGMLEKINDACDLSAHIYRLLSEGRSVTGS